MDLKEFIDNLNQAIIKTYTIPIVHYDLEEVKRIYNNLTNLKNVWVSQYESFLIYDAPEKTQLKRRIDLIEKKLDEWLNPFETEEISQILEFQNPDDVNIYQDYLENIPALLKSIANVIQINLEYIKKNYLKGEKTIDKLKDELLSFADEIKDKEGKGRIFVAALFYLSEKGIIERPSYKKISSYLGNNIVESILAEGTWNSHWNNLKGRNSNSLKSEEEEYCKKRFNKYKGKGLKILKLHNKTIIRQ